MTFYSNYNFIKNFIKSESSSLDPNVLTQLNEVYPFSLITNLTKDNYVEYTKQLYKDAIYQLFNSNIFKNDEKNGLKFIELINSENKIFEDITKNKTLFDVIPELLKFDILIDDEKHIVNFGTTPVVKIVLKLIEKIKEKLNIKEITDSDIQKITDLLSGKESIKLYNDINDELNLDTSKFLLPFIFEISREYFSEKSELTRDFFFQNYKVSDILFEYYRELFLIRHSMIYLKDALIAASGNKIVKRIENNDVFGFNDIVDEISRISTTEYDYFIDNIALGIEDIRNDVKESIRKSLNNLKSKSWRESYGK